METMKKKMSEIAWVEWSVPARETVYEEAVSELGLDYLDYPDWVLDDIECSDGISAESYKIVPGAEPDVEKYPIPALESIKTGYSRTIMSCLSSFPEFSMLDMSEKFYQALCQLKDVWPHPKAIEQLRNIAGKLIPLLNDAKKLGDKKVSLAKRMGLMEVAANIERAYKTFCMIELTGDIHVDSEQLFIIHKVDPDELRTAMYSAFRLDRIATEKLCRFILSNQNKEALIPDLVTNTKNNNMIQMLNDSYGPKKSKKDARDYMAALVCYVWVTIPECGSKSKATNFVFFKAKEGHDLFGECVYARELLTKYGYNPNTIKTRAAEMHSQMTTFHKTGMKWADGWTEMVRKSRAKGE